MPLFKRKPFALLEPPSDLEPREHVFQIRFTKEIFRDYQSYLKRINLYRQRLWTCKITGKGNMTYEEALVSEQHGLEKVQEFPEEIIGPMLRIIQYSMLPLSDLVRKIKTDLEVIEGGEVQGKKDGGVHPCRIVKILREEGSNARYEVMWLDDDAKINGRTVLGEEDVIRKKFPYGREVLKSFVRESTYRNLPWVIHNNIASKYGIPTDLPEDLKGKLSLLNGCVVNNKKRKNNEEQNGGSNDKNKRSKSEGKNSRSPGSDAVVENGYEPIKYPIDDQLVQPGPDDPIFTTRPPPSRDMTIQMECLGDLLMVWDFCASFGRFLYLWPYSLEDFEKAICHKDSTPALVMETHSALLRLLIKDEGQYYMVVEKKKRKSKITQITWMEYLCDFMEMIGDPEILTHVATIKRGHYGLLDPSIKVRILKELVDHAVATDLVREMLDNYLEQRHELAAAKRGEAIEEAKKKREAKERLKAVSETNGNVLDDSLGPTEDIPVIMKCYGERLENGHAENMSSDPKNSVENGESNTKSNGLHENPKKLLEKLERSKEQRKEFLEKEMEKRVIRTNSLGKDRDYNRYWFFRRDGRLFIESSDSKQWGYYSTKDELDALVGSLNSKGERERALKKQLEKHYPKICKELQKRSRDIAQAIEIEDAVVRRSTRVRAPPKDNPAMRFLRYSNKWKVLTG